MREPVIAEDGHTYEKAAIENWLEKSPTSPMTRQQISHAKLIPNLALKQLIDQWKDEQRKSKGKAKVADEAQPLAKAGYALLLLSLSLSDVERMPFKALLRLPRHSRR
jgi:hypothetical protein